MDYWDKTEGFTDGVSALMRGGFDRIHCRLVAEGSPTPIPRLTDDEFVAWMNLIEAAPAMLSALMLAAPVCEDAITAASRGEMGLQHELDEASAKLNLDAARKAWEAVTAAIARNVLLLAIARCAADQRGMGQESLRFDDDLEDGGTVAQALDAIFPGDPDED